MQHPFAPNSLQYLCHVCPFSRTSNIEWHKSCSNYVVLLANNEEERFSIAKFIFSRTKRRTAWRFLVRRGKKSASSKCFLHKQLTRRAELTLEAYSSATKFHQPFKSRYFESNYQKFPDREAMSVLATGEGLLSTWHFRQESIRIRITTSVVATNWNSSQN